MEATSETPKAMPQTAIAPTDGQTTSPVEFIELGLGLEMLLETHPVFTDAVKAALLPLDGEFLFELPLGEMPESIDLGADLLKLLASPDLANRRWIWEQYDSQVGADTLRSKRR